MIRVRVVSPCSLHDISIYTVHTIVTKHSCSSVGLTISVAGKIVRQKLQLVPVVLSFKKILPKCLCA